MSLMHNCSSLELEEALTATLYADGNGLIELFDEKFDSGRRTSEDVLREN